LDRVSRRKASGISGALEINLLSLPIFFSDIGKKLIFLISKQLEIRNVKILSLRDVPRGLKLGPKFAMNVNPAVVGLFKTLFSDKL